MIKLIDLLKEVANTTPTPEEQKVIDDILGSLQEGAFDNLLAKAKSYAKKGLLTATVIAALVASPELTNAQKKQIEAIPTTQTIGQKEVAMDPNDPADVKNVDSNYMKWVLGTSDDGILGQYTSQFKFPNARLETDNKIIQLGLEDNKTLDIISNFDKGKMNQWNKFVDWMVASKIDGKKISGNPELDKDSTIGMDVVRAYKETPAGKNFWVNDGDDIKEVQRYIKAYRDYTIASWKAGAKNLKGNYPGINLRKL
jgi:hypothetical protein